MRGCFAMGCKFLGGLGYFAAACAVLYQLPRGHFIDAAFGALCNASIGWVFYAIARYVESPKAPEDIPE